jgi:hypothetical protein
MVTDERGTRIREVRGRLAREGPVWIRGADLDFETVTLPERDCDLLRDLLIAEGVETAVEVGLAYGSWALAVGEALAAVGAPSPRHLVIDRFQEHAYADVGWELMCSAGWPARRGSVPARRPAPRPSAAGRSSRPAGCPGGRAGTRRTAAPGTGQPARLLVLADLFVHLHADQVGCLA